LTHSIPTHKLTTTQCSSCTIISSRSTLALASSDTATINASSHLVANITNALLSIVPRQVKRNNTFNRQAYEFDIGDTDPTDPITVLRSKFEMRRCEGRVMFEPTARLVEKLKEVLTRRLSSKRRRGIAEPQSVISLQAVQQQQQQRVSREYLGAQLNYTK
jgi:RED-like protein N-terminal region